MKFSKNLAFRIGAKWILKPEIALGIDGLSSFSNHPNAKFTLVITGYPDDGRDQTKSKLARVFVTDENGRHVGATSEPRSYTHSFLKRNAEYQGTST